MVWAEMALAVRRPLQVLAAALSLLSVGLGLWAMLAPESFFAVVATYPPYNRHLVHDLGAFQLGLGGCLGMALFVRSALLAALAGTAIGAVAHFASHVVDRGLGGRPGDVMTVGVLAAVLVALTALQAARVGRAHGD